jgi:hypothetical protein
MLSLTTPLDTGEFSPNDDSTFRSDPIVILPVFNHPYTAYLLIPTLSANSDCVVADLIKASFNQVFISSCVFNLSLLIIPFDADHLIEIMPLAPQSNERE